MIAKGSRVLAVAALAGTFALGGLAANGALAQDATPAAGDWQGLYFEGTSDPRNSVQYARIAGAGAVMRVRFPLPVG